jgi:hypothetical protein
VSISKLFTQFGKLLGRGPRSSESNQKQDTASNAHFHKREEFYRRKHARVTLVALHAVIFELIDTANAGLVRQVELANLSISGMGLFTEKMPPGLKSDDLIEGYLVCGTQKAKVSARVVHIGKTVTGCQFVGHDAEVNKLVQSYFSLELSALTMISVKPELLQEDPDGTPHWIHGKNNCELFFVSQGNEVIRFNLTFFGNYIEGGKQMKAKYGQIMEDEGALGKPRHKSSALIRWDSELAAQLEPYALRFLASVPHLDESHRSTLSSLLSEKP